MPAKDKYHDTVVRSLRKDGWTIVSEQATLYLTQRRLWIDIYAQHGNETAIFVEIKSFDTIPSPVEALAEAVGKYTLYRSALRYLNLEIPLYMAIPVNAFEGILQEDIGQQLLIDEQIPLLIFDPVNEEILEWIH